MKAQATRPVDNEAPRIGANPFTRQWDARLSEGDQEYLARNELWFGRELEYLALLERSISACPGSAPRSLEIGCGTAYSSLHLAMKAGAVPYVADISYEALDLARRTFRLGSTNGSSTVRPILADTRRLPFPDGVFDLVFSAGLLEHFTDPFSVMKEQARVVRPGGRLLVCVPQTFTIYTVAKQILLQLGRWPHGWETQFSARTLSELGDRAGLRVVSLTGSGHDKISRMLLWLPNLLFGDAVRRLEKRFGHLFMKNLIAVFERPA